MIIKSRRKWDFILFYFIFYFIFWRSLSWENACSAGLSHASQYSHALRNSRMWPLSDMRTWMPTHTRVSLRILHSLFRVIFARLVFYNVSLSVRVQRRSWSDCADAQPDQDLRCSHMALTSYIPTLCIIHICWCIHIVLVCRLHL